MNALYYSTGRAARVLGVTQAQVRTLCQSQAIAVEVTDGGQWRVPKAEVERLKRDGLPSAPRPLPRESPRPTPAKARYGHPALLAEPSEEVVVGAEEVAITENLLRKRKLERELEETEDWFREREQEAAEQQAAQQEEERARIAAEEAQRQREEWLQGWEQYAIRSVSYDAPPEVRLEIHQAVRNRLEDLRPMPTPEVTRRLVDAEVQKIVRVWGRAKEIEQAIESAVNRLPSQARSYYKPTDWQIRATQAARQAIRQLDRDASLAEIEAAARRAVEQIARDFEAHKAAQEDTEMRQRIIQWTPLPDGLTDEGKETAKQAVAEALAKLPPGTPRHKLEQARDVALAPFSAAVARHQQEQAQRAAEARRKQEEHAARQGILAWASWKLPWDFPAEQRESALASVSKVIGEMPEGTPRQQLEQARDQALQPFLDAHARRKHKEQLIEDGLRGIFAYILKLEQDWDFEGKTAWNLEQEIREPIRKQLDQELSGAESPEQVAKRVRRLVQEKLGIERRLVHVQKAS